jgi:ribonuclease HI
MSKNKFYVVWEGHIPGVYESWEECQTQIKNYKNPRYKGFPLENAAHKAFSAPWQNYYLQRESAKQLAVTLQAEEFQPKWESIAVDASCLGNPGLMEYRGVYVKTGKEIFRSEILADGTNNIGEFLAIVHGLALLKQKNSSLPIYSDSVNAMNWVRNKKTKTKLEHTDKNDRIFDLIARAEKWLATSTYSTEIMKWRTEKWGEIPADFGRKNK